MAPGGRSKAPPDTSGKKQCQELSVSGLPLTLSMAGPLTNHNPHMLDDFTRTDVPTDWDEKKDIEEFTDRFGEEKGNLCEHGLAVIDWVLAYRMQLAIRWRRVPALVRPLQLAVDCL